MTSLRPSSPENGGGVVTVHPSSTPSLDELRLAAIDLDGTLLGARQEISRENRDAVAKLVDAGMEIVLASGRHYFSMLPFALQLPGVRWLVAAQGGEVSDVGRGRVLERHFLMREQLAAIVEVVGTCGVPAVYYGAEGVLTDSPAGEALEFYSMLSGNKLRRVSTKELERESIFKVVAVASTSEIEDLIANRAVQALDLQRVRTHQRLFEFMPAGVTKATALRAIAAHLGLTERNVVAFGDGDNDVPMLQWAGLSFAMPHGWPSAKAHAKRIGPSGDPNSALARAVATLL